MFHPQSALIVHKIMLGGRGRIDIESYIGSDEINQMIQASSEIKNQVLTTTSNTLDMKKSCIST